MLPVNLQPAGFTSGRELFATLVPRAAFSFLDAEISSLISVMRILVTRMDWFVPRQRAASCFETT